MRAPLRRGDGGEPVKDLQRRLNNLGSVLLIDGDFGIDTETAVVEACQALQLRESVEADEALLQALADAPEPFPPLGAPGVTFIARLEIGSPSDYRAKYARPTWAGERSGITIGVGYDLRFVDEAELRADWGGWLPEGALVRLARVAGSVGSTAMEDAVSDMNVPLLGATAVFLGRMLPKHLDATRAIYPTIGELTRAQRCALVSLVFNRGNDLDGPRRAEMRRIQGLLSARNLDGVPDQIESMTRLWSPTRERGLIDRRRSEAALWRGGFVPLSLE